MRSILAVMLILVVALYGCNLPDISINSPTPTVDTIETQVVQKLTAAILTTKGPAATSGPAKPTAVAPSATSLPSASPSPSVQPSQTAVKSPTIGASPTPGSSPTPTKTSTATSIPGDPRGSLGAPTWKDSFQKASTWGLATPYDDGHTRISIETGKLILKSYEANGWRGWRMMNLKIQAFYLEATLKPLACAGNDLYGLVFRSTDNFKGFWYSLTCDGKYALQSGDINNFADVIKPKSSSLITAGSNQTQRLGIMAKGNKISLYINGKLLEEISSDLFPDPGAFGYFIAGNQTPGFTVESTEIDYWIVS